MTTVLAGLLLLLVTGSAVNRLLPARVSRDPLTAAALDLGSGLAFWPVVLLWASLAGLRLGPGAVRSIAGALLLVIAINLVRRRRAGRPLIAIPPRETLIPFAAIAAAAAWTRYEHVRDLALPAWVDSTHHMMIVRLFVERGAIPASYEPYIPDSDAYYHWGYHAITAAVVWLTGRSDPFEIARAMIDFGQLLNMLTVLTVYAAGRSLFRSTRAGLWAAAFATLVSYFPAYYVSWGRYTQLSGTLLLPLVMLAVSRARTKRPGSIAVAALLAAGLALVHVRLALLAATALAVVALWRLGRRGLPRFGAWVAVALLALLLAAPWLARLGANHYVHRILAPQAAGGDEWETPTGVRADLARAPRNVELFVAGTGGIAGLFLWGELGTAWRTIAVALWLGAMLLSERAHRRKLPLARFGRGVAALAGWAALTAIVLNLQWLGLPRLRIASNTSAVITLFIPLCLSLGGMIAAATAALATRRTVAASATALAIVALAGTGAMTFRDVVNPATILATGNDLAAMRWIRDHAPADSVFMVRTRPWLGRSRMGTDGGAWIELLTGRKSALPPGLYPWVAPAGTVDRIESSLQEFQEGAAHPDTALCEALRSRGITHVYFGDRDEGPSDAAFAAAGFARSVYDAGGVKIFELARNCEGLPAR